MRVGASVRVHGYNEVERVKWWWDVLSWGGGGVGVGERGVGLKWGGEGVVSERVKSKNRQ